MKPNIIQRICGRLTGHRFRRRYNVKDNGRQYCRCRLCGWHFWEDEKMHENMIRVIIKEPGKEPREDHFFPNTLEAFQKAVGGYIEAVAVSHHVVLICNEEGRLIGLPENFDGFVGPVVAVGVKGPEFVFLRNQDVGMVLELIRGSHG